MCTSRSDLLESLYFHTACWFSKIVFFVASCPKWKRHNLTSQPGHPVVVAWVRSQDNLLLDNSTPSVAVADTTIWIHPHMTFVVYWPALLSLWIVNIGGKTSTPISMSRQRKPRHWSYERVRLAVKHCDIFFPEPLTSKIILSELWPLVQNCNASWLSSLVGRGSCWEGRALWL